jgi:hypothetical protein
MAVVVNDAYSVITSAGVQAAIASGSAGPQITITGFQLGSLSAADGVTPDPTATGVIDWVYTGNVNQIYYSAEPNSDSCLFRVVLDDSVGDFTVGNIGLMIGTTLFSLSVLYQPQKKWQSNLPSLMGNSMAFDLVLGIANVQSCINLTVLQSLDATLPEVTDETALPDATTTIYNTYVLQNNTTTGVPSLAVRERGEWWMGSMRSVGGQGETVLAVNSNMFDPSCLINMAVYYDYTLNKFMPANPSINWKFPIGVRTSSYELTQTGFVKRYEEGTANDIWPSPLQPGTTYCVSVSAPGIPAAAATYNVYGYCVDENTMYIDMSDTIGASYLAQVSNGGGRIGGVPPASLNEVQLAISGKFGVKVVTSLGENNVVNSTVESTLGDGSRVILI